MDNFNDHQLHLSLNIVKSLPIDMRLNWRALQKKNEPWSKRTKRKKIWRNIIKDVGYIVEKIMEKN